MSTTRTGRRKAVRFPAGTSSETSTKKLTITTTVKKQRALNVSDRPPNKKRRRNEDNDEDDDEDDINDEDYHDEDEDQNDSQIAALSEIEPTSHKMSSVQPNFSNYHELGVEWGQAYAEKTLTSLNLPKNNRPSTAGLFEAQALQSAYGTDKTMLCIIMKCSRKVLDEALLEGPLTREPNMYTNYQTYSNIATNTPMPPKGVSKGFKARNQIVGSTWSSYNPEEQEVFTPRLFERLCIATSEAFALTQTPLGITTSFRDEPKELTNGPSASPPASGIEPLSPQEYDKYGPIFERLVNSQKVAHDLHNGRLWRHSGKTKNRTMEQLMTKEVGKIVRQLHVLKNQFNLQFHILIARWTPDSPSSQALFQEEYMSCERWARSQQKTHLLERFTFESTKAPHHLRETSDGRKAPSPAAIRQAERRTELAKALNNLISPYLRDGYLGKGDAHPKCANLQEALPKKDFRGGIKLDIHRTPESCITDRMLAKGPSSLTNDEVEIWIEDINNKYYTIVKVNATEQKDTTSDKSESDTASTPLHLAEAEIMAELTGNSGSN
ncbi:uncharacterized protein MELLADRAFT_94699 [Melampsora larici-populina 98AG31]|uniref:Uncharacterized protein n=1 Tax=Melampsora larici-populina (strain 98AG31 / pathotype 3-4-7) TaxID=747676 RepID=F4S7M7_MELLP|nr:uncharacterized protein MELLADRAFT_94699 [Melampsora larici-populina 98AG31]EGF99348.1 hypothetical protein MELLADRAFT_94699 [Melampsora larici-populina 98AG31]